MRRRASKKQRVTLDRQELKVILFWAAYGLNKAVGGSYADIALALIPSLSKRYKLQIEKPQLGKYCETE